MGRGKENVSPRVHRAQVKRGEKGRREGLGTMTPSPECIAPETESTLLAAARSHEAPAPPAAPDAVVVAVVVVVVAGHLRLAGEKRERKAWHRTAAVTT